MSHMDYVLSPPGLELGDSSLRASTRQSSQWQRLLSKSSDDLIARYSQTSTSYPENNWRHGLPIGVSSRCTTTPESSSRSNPKSPAIHGHSYHEPSLTSSSSQRIVMTPSTSSQSILPSILHPHMQPDYSRPLSVPLDPPDSSWCRELYSIDPSGRPSRSSTSDLSVKKEPIDSDDGFINEFLGSSPSTSTDFRCQTPPTEVPLRATQASKEMRKMMGVFRLNPFTMHHDGGRGISATAWNGEEVGPLKEEPKLYEYQLGCNEVIEVDIDSEVELRSFSPDFEINNGINDGEAGLPTSKKLRSSARQAPTNSPPRQSALRAHCERNIYTSPLLQSPSLAYPSTPTDDQTGSIDYSYGYSVDGYIEYHCPQSSEPAPPSPYPSSISSAETPCMQSQLDVPSSWSSNDQNTRICESSSMNSLYSNVSPTIQVDSPASLDSTPHYMSSFGGTSTSAARRWSLPANPSAQAPFIL